MNFWLIFERYDNWLSDKANSFQVFGIPIRKIKLAEKICEDDLLITYVSKGYSSFSDVRKVEESGLISSPKGLLYDEPFQFCIKTSPLAVLQPESWIKIHSLLDDLSFLRGREKWATIMLNALRPLTQEDGITLLNAINSKL